MVWFSSALEKFYPLSTATALWQAIYLRMQNSYLEKTRSQQLNVLDSPRLLER
jgi:hypothetical protein